MREKPWRSLRKIRTAASSWQLPLYTQGKVSEAVDAVKPLQDGKHPLYRLLLDIVQAPVPNGAIFDISIAEFSMLVAPEEFHQFRAAGYLYPGPASEVESFYRKIWPGFKRQPNPHSVYAGDPDNGFAAVFRWNDGTLIFSPEPFPSDYMKRGAGEPAEESPLKDALTLLVEERSPPLDKEHLRGTSWEKLPAGFAGERACEIKWINYRSFAQPPRTLSFSVPDPIRPGSKLMARQMAKPMTMTSQ